MEYIAINTSAYFIGKNIASQALLDTTNKVYSTLYIVYSYNNDYINLKLVDLESQIKVIESLIKDIDKNKNYNKLKCVELCINTINDIINNIHLVLFKLHDELKYHKTRWFNYYRTPYYHSYLDILINYKLQLDSRLDLLTKILTISKIL